MPICPICRTSEAEKKNVHLIPWFLIKKSITLRGSGDRDMELSFSIDPSSFTKMYMGRGVLPEKIEEFGELHDLEKEKSNPYSRDNLICDKCEKKLSKLEAIFASQFTEKKIMAASDKSTIQIINGHSLIIDLNYDLSLFQILIQSIFYRCSIGKFNGFSLQPQIQAKIEENLRLVFSNSDFSKLTATSKVEYPNSFPIIVTSTHLIDSDDPTNQFVLINKSRFPYFLVAGKWMFQMFEDEKHLKSSVEWLYGLSTKLNFVEAFRLTKESAHLILLESKSAILIGQNMIDFYSSKKIEGLKKSIRDLYKHIFKTRPDELIAQYIFQQYFFHRNNDRTEYDSMVYAFYDLKKVG